MDVSTSNALPGRRGIALAAGQAIPHARTMCEWPIPMLTKPVFLFSSLLLGTIFFAEMDSVQAQGAVEKLSDGLLIHLGPTQVKLSAVAPDVLRLSVADGQPPYPIPSTFLADSVGAGATDWQFVKKRGMVGVRTKAGQLLINPQTGEWTLLNAQGKALIPRHRIADLSPETPSPDTNVIRIELGWNPHQPIAVYGCGNGVNALQQSKALTGVGNGRAVIPYFWSPAGYAVLAVTTNDNQPARWRGAADGQCVTWTFPGREGELYLMPAATLKDAAQSYARLTGHAPLPPRWAFGYLQSRWGWKDRAYIEDTLKQFEELKIPVDAFIYDFEWFTTEPDYDVPPQGIPGYTDFGWNTNLFPHPAQQIRDYKNQGVHFVGIRKPRLGNAASLKLIRANGWALPVKSGAKFQARDLNFANPDLRAWYVRQSAPLLRAGVDGWWNDEGEGTYTTYFYWNLAEQEAWQRYKPDQRMWTLNRAFSPGLQRFGAAAWTGDIPSTWKALAQTPTSLLNWSLAGMPYGACDIGGFTGNPSPELLSRWMEAGVFFPVMRSHSSIDRTPRFPWLYGTNALHAIRRAIELRYRLIPFYYSLAYETFHTGLPIMRPLCLEFPNDPNVANLSDEWMMGDSLLVAPLLQPGGKRSVYLPPGGWYAFGSCKLFKGPRTLEVTAALDEIPVYIRAGSILPLGPALQHTSQLPGGPLELQIYPGQDATFTLYEDDGESLNYLNGAFRCTTFRWRDKTRQLTWESIGSYKGSDTFKNLHVILFDPHGQAEAERPLGSHGSIRLPRSP